MHEAQVARSKEATLNCLFTLYLSVEVFLRQIRPTPVAACFGGRRQPDLSYVSCGFALLAREVHDRHREAINTPRIAAAHKHPTAKALRGLVSSGVGTMQTKSIPAVVCVCVGVEDVNPSILQRALAHDEPLLAAAAHEHGVLGESVRGEDDATETVGGKGVVEALDRSSCHRLRGIDHVSDAGQVQGRPLLLRQGLEFPRAQDVREIGRLRKMDQRTGLRNTNQQDAHRIASSGRQPACACHVSVPAAEEDAQICADQAHVVILRQPADHDRVLHSLQVGRNRLEVVCKVAEGDLDALRLRSRPGSELKERHVVGIGTLFRPTGEVPVDHGLLGLATARVRDHPAQRVRPAVLIPGEDTTKARRLLQVVVRRAGQGRRGAAGVVDGAEHVQILAQFAWIRREDGHRDDSRLFASSVLSATLLSASGYRKKKTAPTTHLQAREESHQEVQTRKIHEERAVSGRQANGLVLQQSLRQVIRSSCELRVAVFLLRPREERQETVGIFPSRYNNSCFAG
eukprot:scaffold301_cov243-Pinguiococcus_pyrenoidosus.AAC.92